MARYRTALLQLDGGLFLADGGREEAALRTMEERVLLRERLLGLLELAGALGAGFILDAPLPSKDRLPPSAAEAEAADLEAVAFAAGLRDEAALERPVVLNATFASCPDWDGEWHIVADEADRLFVSRLGWLARSEIDMVSGPALGDAARAVGFVEAVCAAELPVAAALSVDSNGRLADGQPLREAVEAVDAFTGAAAVWFTVCCADPAHLAAALDGSEGWNRRIRGLRVEPAFPDEIAAASLRGSYAELAGKAPWIAIADLAGGSNLRHVAAMARAIRDAAEFRAEALPQ